VPPAANLPPPATVGVGVGAKKGPGRAELPDEMIGKGGGVGLGMGEMEKENVISEVSPVSPESGKVEMDGRGEGLGQGQGRYGLRPEELDGDGRYVGELHGDGRQFGGGGVELEGSGVLR
jgi:hypothetical protein